MLIIGLMASYAAHYPMLYVYVRENLANVSGERSQWSAHMRSVNRRYDNAIIGNRAGRDRQRNHPTPYLRSGDRVWQNRDGGLDKPLVRPGSIARECGNDR